MITKIIHMSSAIERNGLVHELVKLTGGEVFEAIVVPGNGVAGCLQSHTEIYKQVPDGHDLLVFEDDCIIKDRSYVDFINRNKSVFDIIYLGVNCINAFDETGKPLSSWGTHSMWISNKAIKIFLNHIPIVRELDNIWCEIEQFHKLKVLRPNPIDKYTIQKEGLKSYITGIVAPRTYGKVKW